MLIRVCRESAFAYKQIPILSFALLVLSIKLHCIPLIFGMQWSIGRKVMSCPSFASSKADCSLMPAREWICCFNLWTPQPLLLRWQDCCFYRYSIDIACFQPVLMRSAGVCTSNVKSSSKLLRAQWHRGIIASTQKVIHQKSNCIRS